ncbi:acyl-CoA dehydrogenase [Dactylosporangium sp. NPDC049525]|uniref:acyl-CoA dehydrogenase family protein n=1 Tax=Dactylosporangium sp. NPDC049525 TaxID=3154730 RepID=UPI0034168992
MTAPPAGGRSAGTVLEDALGDPDEAGRTAAAADAGELFPAEACGRLDEAGLAAHYVPAGHGGRLENHEELLRLVRVVARRDLTAAVAHAKTYLGAAPVWVAADPEQARAVAAAVLAAAPVGWALSEPDHGADLLNGSCVAVPHPGGYRLDGVKWPVNNATRADLLTVLARTGERGARGHSLFVFDKSTARPGSWRALPKVLTHGIRGADISGIEFTGADVPASARVGAEGTGVETVLRALQLTRTMCASLSLGAGEHALRVTARFVAGRVIQRHPLIERPYHASVLGRAAAHLAAVEAATIAACRGIHGLTPEMSVVSAVAKALAPTLVDALLAELAELLGARSFLTGVHEHGAFQKLRRDHQVVAVFDGSTPVNRAALIQQFPRLVRGWSERATDTDGLRETVRPGGPVRPLDPAALTLLSRRGCSVVQSLPDLAASISASVTASAGVPAGLAEHARALCDELGEVHTRMARVRPAARPAMVSYELAAAYELGFAGAACLHLWAAGEEQHRGEPLWEDGLWVRAALRALRSRTATILRLPRPEPVQGDEYADEQLARVVADAARTGAPVTPFGDPMPVPAGQGGDPGGR